MPPRRKANVSTRAQPTLSFNNKSARITKNQSSTSQPALAEKKSLSKLNEPAKAEIIAQISEPDVAAAAPAEQEIQPEQELQDQKSQIQSNVTKPKRKSKKNLEAQNAESSFEQVRSKAEKFNDSRIKSYWMAEENSRLAPRVHQQTLPVHEKILRHFDLSSQYGPCIGVPRLARWKRAFGLGLNPPVEVLAVLLKEEKKGSERGQGGRQCGVLAYIDELSGGREVLVE